MTTLNFDGKIFTGRQKITTSYTFDELRDINNVINCINDSMQIHDSNALEINYLISYKNGMQPVKYKEKDVRPEINNKIVFNHAQMVTRMIVGYFLGTPIQYTQSTAEKKDQIDLLNRYVAYEDKATIDKEIGDYQSICGTAYRIIYSNEDDIVPFQDKCLNPANTFVVYRNDVSETPCLGVYFFDYLDVESETYRRKYYAYTTYGVYEFVTPVGTFVLNQVDINSDEYKFTEYYVGGIPIIEYPNNIWRIGDWELCLDLMDAINLLQSGRLDDVEQIVQSLLVFVNADINAETYKEMRQAGVIVLNNSNGLNTEVQSIQNPLDQTGMNLISKEFEELLYALLSIPDRNNRSGGGGDTGQAVELRDGWADLEIVARNKELTFKKSEKQALKIILNIMNASIGTDLSVLNKNIKLSRNKNNNLLVKTQAYMNLLGTKTLDPSDCLTIIDLVSDVNDFIERGKVFWGDEFANKTVQEVVSPILTEDTIVNTEENVPTEDNSME